MLNRYLRALSTGATVITANARLARVIRREYNRRKREEATAGRAAVWPTPVVLPWTSWLEQMWRRSLYRSTDTTPLVLLQPAHEQAIWESVIELSDGASALLDLPATARSARAAWELVREWRLELDHPAWIESDDTAAFREWAQQFEVHCRARNWLSGALLADAILPVFRDRAHHAHDVLVAGFDEFSPRQREILSALQNAGGNLEVVETAGTEPRGVVHRVGLTDIDSELAAAAQWCRAILAAEPASSIAVVVPALASLRVKVVRIFSDVLHPGSILPGAAAETAFNISLGRPLIEYPLIDAALAALDLGQDSLPIKIAGNLIRSPFLRGGIQEASHRALLDVGIRGRGGLEIRMTTLQNLAANPPERWKSPPCPVFAGMLAEFLGYRHSLKAKQTYCEWARDFSRLQEILGWPGERTLASAEYQAFEKWQSALDQFAALDTVAPPCGYRQAAGALRRVAGNIIFQPESSDAPVQILGVLEAAGQRFDHLWVAGLHDAAWPPAASPQPFIPLRLQRERRLPHASAARELEYTSLVNRRLMRSAANVILSYPRRDGDLELRPSRLIVDESETTLENLVAQPVPAYAGVQFSSVRMETVRDDQAPSLPGSAETVGGSGILKEQAACPFRAFAKLRLHAEPLEAPQAGLSAIDRGNLVHAAIERVWRTIGSQEVLSAAGRDRLTDVVHSAVTAALADLGSKRDDIPNRTLAVEAGLLQTLLAEWLEFEKERVPFSILHLEHRAHASLAGVWLNLRADRIDRLADGRHVLIDYKTGSPSLKQWDGDRPDEPQLPLYAVTGGIDLAAVAFAQVRRGDLRFKGTCTEEGILPGAGVSDTGWETQLAEWRRVLEALVRDFHDGVATVNPKRPGSGFGGTCQYCGLQPFCRIAEANAAEDDQEIAEAAHA